MQLCSFHHNSCNCQVPDRSLTTYSHFQIDVTKNLCSSTLWFNGVVLPFNSTTYLHTLTSNVIWVGWFVIPIWLPTNFFEPVSAGSVNDDIYLPTNYLNWGPNYNIPQSDIISCIVSGKKNFSKQSHRGLWPVLPKGVSEVLEYYCNSSQQCQSFVKGSNFSWYAM